MISSEVVSMSGATTVDLRSRGVDSDASVDNVLPSNAMLDAADDGTVEGSVANDSLVVNDEDVVHSSATEPEDVSSIVCTSIVD